MKKIIRGIFSAAVLFGLSVSAHGADIKKVIPGPEGRLQYYPKISSITIGDLESGIQVLDEGALQGGATWFNFVGAAIQATCNGGTCTITVSASGGGGGGGAGAYFDRTQTVSITTWTIPFVIPSFSGSFATVPVFASTANITGSWTYYSTQTFKNLIYGSSITASGLFVSSNGLLVGGVLYTTQMSTADAAILARLRLTDWVVSRDTGDALDLTTLNFISTHSAKDLFHDNAFSTHSAKDLELSNSTNTIANRTAVIIAQNGGTRQGDMSTLNLTGTAVTGFSCVGTTCTATLTAGSGGGGGASSLAIGKGSLQDFTQVSSPTSHISFASGPFIVTLINPTTAFIGLDYSSFTMQGQITASAGGGSTPYLAVGTGSAQALNIISSPTAQMTFSTPTFRVTPIGTTSYIELDGFLITYGSHAVYGVITTTSSVIAQSISVNTLNIGGGISLNAGQITSHEGTPANPIINFGTSNNTGFYMDSSLTLGLSARGTRAYYADQQGRTVIGPMRPANVLPQATLEVVHSAFYDETTPLLYVTSKTASGVGAAIPYFYVGRDTVGVNTNMIVSSPTVLSTATAFSMSVSSFAVTGATVCLGGTCGFFASTSAPGTDLLLHRGPDGKFYFGGDQAGAGGSGITEDQANALIISTWNAADQLASTQTITGSKTIISSTTFSGQTALKGGVFVTTTVLLNSDSGTNGQLFMSGGNNAIPSWITPSMVVTYKAGVCQGVSPSLGFSYYATSAPAASCQITSTTVVGVAQFSDISTNTVQDHLRLPSNWTGAVDAGIVWTSSTSSTNNVVWKLRTSCVADAENPNVTWNNADTVTDAAKGVNGQYNTATISNITTTGCSAGEELFFEFYREGWDINDTYVGVGSLISLQFTIRRTF